MAHPAAAQVQHPAFPGQGFRIVAFQQRDGVVVNVRHEARRGVEICIGAFVCAEEIRGGVGEGTVGGVGGVGCFWEG